MTETHAVSDRVDPTLVKIYQAAGMLSVQLDTSCDRALRHLLDHAARTHRSVTDVALDVLGRQLSFQPGDQPEQPPVAASFTETVTTAPVHHLHEQFTASFDAVEARSEQHVIDAEVGVTRVRALRARFQGLEHLTDQHRHPR